MKTLVLLSSMATRALLHAAADDFQRTHGIRIDARAAGGVEVARRIEAGEAADIIVLARDAIDKLAAASPQPAGAIC